MRINSQKREPRRSNNRLFLFVAVCVSIFVLDQSTKSFFLQTHTLVTYNSGIAFGVGKGISAPLLVFLLVLLLLDFFRRGAQLLEALIFSGGMSNVLDRFLRDGVVDWIRFGPLWFNIADISITFGVLWLLFRLGQQAMKSKVRQGRLT